jgi:molecular chaperone DnaK
MLPPKGETDMEPVVGIDLGTTFSAIACVNKDTGRAEILPDPDTQERITASAVFFESESNIIVGKIAKENAIADPDSVVEFVKRRIGTDWTFTLGPRKRTPQEISAHILKKLKGDAEKRLGQPVSKTVITVPAYFGELQRAATKEAGRLAGLEVLEILDEPVAAALAYGLDRLGRDQTVFVFDLGGGTFDVTIISIKGKEIREIAIDGDYALGGKNWDDLLIDHLSAKFETQHRSNPKDDRATYQDLQLRAIRAKEELSRKDRTRVTVQHAGNMANVEVTTQGFEELTQTLVGRCEMLCDSVLGKASMSWAGIDTVLLVGGATRMPMIVEMVKRVSGKSPSTELNPDECVAQGAAWQALMIQTRGDRGAAAEWAAVNPAVATKLRDVKVRKITSHEIGVIAFKNETDVERSFLIIPRFTPVPCDVRDDTFRTREHNQSAVRFRVTEGGSYLDARDCEPGGCTILGEVTVGDLPPHPAGSPVEVTLRITEGKLMEVTARDVVSGKSATASIHVENQLTEEEFAVAQTAVRRASVSG